MGIAETLEYIHSVKWQGSKPGLERTRELLAALGNPEKSLRFVHVAGTNGKGSTAACIASVLREAGYRTGLYISPYIRCFNERMQINGEYISDSELESMTNEIRPHADSMKDPPTEFEIITALAMRFFLCRSCDVVVMEVGMGGELDSTNVIGRPDVAVITALGLDHVKELGPTIAHIAAAKAGIIKSGGDVVIYGGEAEAMAVLEDISAKRGARLIKADFSRISGEGFSLDGVDFDFARLGRVSIPLAGAYQPKNAAVAITAIEVLREKGYEIGDDDIITGLKSVSWPGRFEALGKRPVFILEGAHNVQGIEASTQSLRRLFGDRKVVFLIGVSADKDVDQMLDRLAPLAEVFIAISADSPRALGAGVLAGKLYRYGVPVTACQTIPGGVAEALKAAGKDGIICALGSLFISADVRSAYIAATR